MILMKAIKVNHPGAEFVLVQKDVPACGLWLNTGD